MVKHVFLLCHKGVDLLAYLELFWGTHLLHHLFHGVLGFEITVVLRLSHCFPHAVCLMFMVMLVFL